MQTGGVTESVAPDDGFIGLHMKTCQVADQTTRPVNLLRINARRQVKEIVAGFNRHDNFL